MKFRSANAITKVASAPARRPTVLRRKVKHLGNVGLNARWRISAVLAVVISYLSAATADVPRMHPEHWYEISDWIPFEDNDSCWITSTIMLEKSAADNMSIVGSMFVSYFDGDPVPEVSITMLEPYTNLQRTTLLLFDSEIELEANSEDAWLKTDDMPAAIAALRAGEQIEIRIEDLYHGEIHAIVGTRGFQMALNAISRTCWFAKGTGAAEFDGRG